MGGGDGSTGKRDLEAIKRSRQIALAEPLTERREYFLPKGRGSFSMFRKYMECPACWEAEYINLVPMPVAEALIVGGAVHGGVAAARRAVRAGNHYQLADCLRETTVEFVRTAGVPVPDQTDSTDALVLLNKAVEIGDIKIQWKDYPDPREALAACHRFVDAALSQILRYEAEVGYKLVEAEIEYGDALPFKFIGRIDALLKNNDLRELKTSGQRRAPDFFASWQLRTQALPLWAAEDAFSLSLVQMVKNTQVDVRLFHLPVTDAQMIAARRMLIDIADGISSGYYPARPGYWCDFPELHQTPSFVSAA